MQRFLSRTHTSGSAGLPLRRPGRLIFGLALMTGVSLLTTAPSAGAAVMAHATATTRNAAAVPEDGAGTNQLGSGEILKSGQMLVYGAFELHMGTDGNIVLTDDGHAVWANGKTGNQGAYLYMQPGGNCVEWSADGTTVIWATNTGGNPGAYLAIGPHGYPKVVSTTGAYLWTAPYPNTYFDPNQSDVLFAGQSLGAPGQQMLSAVPPPGDARTQYSLYEYQGYLEEYVNGTQDLIWWTGSPCSGTSSADMQSDGNFVLYCNGVSIWSTGTGGHPASYGYFLHLLTSGKFIIQSNYGQTEWSS